jgi:hypothetical protein
MRYLVGPLRSLRPRCAPVWLRGHLRISPRSDHGGVAILVAVMLGFGALLGVGALVIDFGQVYVEREELQTSADAAALAVAKNCAVSPGSCASASVSTAKSYADRNSRDGVSRVAVICGTGRGLSACPAQPTGRSACIGREPASVSYVEVRTSTELADGSTLLPPTFAWALADNGNYQGTRVSACARYVWGPLQATPVVAIGVSTCEWNKVTSNGTVLQPNPPTASGEVALHLQNTIGATSCPSTTAGWNNPNGFGWTDENPSSCYNVAPAVGGTMGGDMDNVYKSECDTRLKDSRTNRTVLTLPIYDGVKGHISYHVVGFAAFVVTGYNLPAQGGRGGLVAPSILSNEHLCPSTEHCLYGYFTGRITANGVLVAGTSYGISVVKLAG